MISVVSCLGDSHFSDSYPIFVTFEYEDAIFDKDSLYYATDGSTLGFVWDGLAFYNEVDKETSEFKGGFLLSRLNIPASGQTEELANNRFRVNCKSGLGKFAVFCQTDDMPDKDMEFYYSIPGATSTCTMHSVLVNNTVEVADAVKSKLEPGQKLLLKATGYKKDQDAPTGETEIRLADISSDKDSIISSWTSFDLSKLGDIDQVRFSIETEPEGLDIPKAVCLDYLVANITITSK